MSQQLLKRSLALLDGDSEGMNRKKTYKANKSKKSKLKKRLNGKPRVADNGTKVNQMNAKPKSIEIFKELHKNKIKYKLIKDLMVSSDRKSTHVSDKSESIFTEKDFKEFALNYK
ncbi:unnamed protein product [Oppiella nova]|uniref:Active regulator of SIRT1 n=1 Tax=Oppiella nova TaxID=334625 RepID=A0A7R9QN72_9ACAR|nr:unnamed protein product [Oppiella nova]CAG2168923.1 unnamed protein product [Oppiella nova]